jgi:hypothetical protein
MNAAFITSPFTCRLLWSSPIIVIEPPPDNQDGAVAPSLYILPGPFFDAIKLFRENREDGQ